MAHLPRLRLEYLDERCLPATWGNPWPDATHLSVSFAPDGTAIGDRTSALFATMNQIAPAAQWQRELLRAMQTWAVNANINITLAADNGSAFGITGSSQGDERFGDVRFAGYEMGNDVLALSSPFDALAGTWSGDVRLNFATEYGIGSSAGIDLYSAMLHEAGHIFGLNHSTNPASPMFASYQGIRTGLIAEDVTRLQSLYGSRRHDSWEGSAGNNSRTLATPLSLLQHSDGSLRLTVSGDITTAIDHDYFSFSTGLLSGSAFIRLTTKNISLLTGQIQVQDQFGNALATATATDSTNGDLVLAVNGLLPLHTYYVRVGPGSSDVFGVGSYQLQVARFPLLGALTGGVLNTLTQVTEPVLTLLAQQDLHTNDSPLLATLVPPLTSQTTSQFDFAFRGGISDNIDRDFYRLTAPAGASVLTAMVWATPGNGSLMPRVRVYDSNGVEIAAEILVQDSSNAVVQVDNVTPGASYFVEVRAADTAPPDNRVGNYFLGIDVNGVNSELEEFASVGVSGMQPSRTEYLTVARTRLFHFLLSAQASQAASIQIVIRNSQNEIVYSLAGTTAEPQSGRVALRPGHYSVQFVGTPPAGSLLPLLTVHLRGAVIDDPIGPKPVDPTEDPSGDSTPTNSEYDYYWSGRDSRWWDGGAYSDPVVMA